MRKPMFSSIGHALLLLLICFLLQKSTQAIKQSYIVYLGPHSYGPSLSSLDVEFVTNSHSNLLRSYVGSTEKAKDAIFYSYNKYFNGFAAMLDEDEAAMVAKDPNVVSVFSNRALKLHTTHSWDFLDLGRNGFIRKNGAWSKTKGEDVIIGNIDTGVWPESKSFSDEGMGPIPTKWRGICEVDQNNTDKFSCNRKLIGARYFYKGYLAGVGDKNNTSVFNSARDFHGHGTHTLSTAGGNFVGKTDVNGHGKGTASGGSPKARVASYKVCWLPVVDGKGCYEADILAAFEAAISDGVDVISMSMGVSPIEFFDNSFSIGSFHAVANGIVVVGSAGNDGPSPSTVVNVEPWLLTVGASTIDRTFSNKVILGNKIKLKGSSLSKDNLRPRKFYPLVKAVDAKVDNASYADALLCNSGSLDPQKTTGKIVVCLRGNVNRGDKGVEAVRAGAAGMVLANSKDVSNIVVAYAHMLPSSMVNFEDGETIFNYINQTSRPVALISRVSTRLGVKPAPLVASFSSRGPNILDPTILKPDIMAPGENIIAAYSEAQDKSGLPFIPMSGTSMSCPHVAGVVGLIKALHPDWSPAAIKSSIMTTAKIEGNYHRKRMVNSLLKKGKYHGKRMVNSLLKKGNYHGKRTVNSLLKNATPFTYGAGHIRPNRAVNPGLVYDLNITDYMNYLCNRGYKDLHLSTFYGKPYTCPKSFSLVDFNYPTITIPSLKIGDSLNVTRTLTNVDSPSKYKVHIVAPDNVLVSVEPKILQFKEKGEKKEFTVTLSLRPLTNRKTHSLFGRSLTNRKTHYLFRRPLTNRKTHYIFERPLTTHTTDYVFGRLVWTDHKHHVQSSIAIKPQ